VEVVIVAEDISLGCSRGKAVEGFERLGLEEIAEFVVELTQRFSISVTHLL